MKVFSKEWDDTNRFVYGIKISSASLKHKWLDVIVKTRWNERGGTYKEADRESWRSTSMVLPPGVAAERRLRAFKVYVLVHR